MSFLILLLKEKGRNKKRENRKYNGKVARLIVGQYGRNAAGGEDPGRGEG